MSVLIVIGLGLTSQAATALLGTLQRESILLLSAEEAPDTACICQPDYVIDSMVKIIEEYPHLKDAYEAAEILIKYEAQLKQEQRGKILKYLRLDAWNMEDIRKRIRRLKWQRLYYAGSGFGLGIITISLLQAIK